jgi:hypothetical protein
MEIRVSFGGGDAEQHRIRAQEGSVALEGVARSIILISHFIVEGEVRKRAPFSENARLYLTHTRPGSFDTLFNLAIENPVAVAVGITAAGVVTSLVCDLMKHAYGKLTGKEQAFETPAAQQINETRGGDLEALVDAVEPSLIRAHNIINNGVVNINIFQDQKSIARFDEETKRYIETTIVEPNPLTKRVSVGAYNANSRYGRIYDASIGKTIPFLVHRDAEARTSTNVAQSLQLYASKRNNPDVNVKYLRSVDLEGRVKRFVILDAWFDQRDAI